MLGSEMGTVIVPTVQMRKLRLPAEKHPSDPCQPVVLCKPHRETLVGIVQRHVALILSQILIIVTKITCEQGPFGPTTWQQEFCSPLIFKSLPPGILPGSPCQGFPVSQRSPFFLDEHRHPSATQWLSLALWEHPLLYIPSSCVWKSLGNSPWPSSSFSSF